MNILSVVKVSSLLFIALWTITTTSALGLQDAESTRTTSSHIPLKQEAEDGVLGSVPATMVNQSTDDNLQMPLKIQIPQFTVIPRWSPRLSKENGLRLWDCIHVALQNNRPLRIARDNLRIAQVTLRERQDEFGNIYQFGSGVHYDENLAYTDIDRYSFSLGGAEGSTAAGPDGSIVSRKFATGGAVSIGGRTTYQSTEIPRYYQLLDGNGNPILDPNGDPSILTRMADVRWFSEANIAVTQPLLEGAGDVALTGLRAQELEQSISNLDLERSVQSLITDVVRDYLAVQRSISLALVQQDSYQRALDAFKLTLDKTPFTPADVAPLQIFRAGQQVTSTQQQFLDSTNNVESSLLNLRLSMGVEPNAPVILAGTDVPKVEPPLMSIEESVVEGLRIRPDLRSMKLMVKQQELYLKASQNALLPNLDFSARMGFRDEDQHLYDSWSLFEYQDVRADLRLNLPLNLPSDRANYERSQIMVRQALTNLQQRERVIANDIDDAYRAQKTYLERTGVLQKNEELARKTYETMAGLAEYGQIDPFDSVQAQNDLTAASAARVRAEIEYVIAMAILDLAQGKPISEILKRYTPLGESAPE